MPSTYEVQPVSIKFELQQIGLESRGTRRKFWILIPDEQILPHERNLWLLKFPRKDTGEHWAEKIAAEVGRLIDVDCARVELANCDGELATICESFNPGNWDELYEYYVDESEIADDEYLWTTDTLWSTDIDQIDIEGSIFIPGSEILASRIDGYDTSPQVRFRQRDHNVRNIINAVKETINGNDDQAGQDLNRVLISLASYAILDGLIGNMDRHHENWEIKDEISNGVRRFSAAPSYDHASSLGRELKDERRTRYLDSNGVLNYLWRGHGAVFSDDQQKRAPSPLQIAKYISQHWPDYTRPILQRIGSTPDSEFRTTIDRVPTEFMSDIAKEFAYQIIVTSKSELLKLTQ
ncbi:MAG: hypothetical protein OXC83_11635 [Chloroflexi bacterium]|nr:hypothetical protein [Chloroflexota bacterium]